MMSVVLGERYKPTLRGLEVIETRTTGVYTLLGDDAVDLVVRIEIREALSSIKEFLSFSLPSGIRIVSGTMTSVRVEKNVPPVFGMALPSMAEHQINTDRMVVYYPSDKNMELFPYIPTSQAFISASGTLRIDKL
jgi:hypothetical protein